MKKIEPSKSGVLSVCTHRFGVFADNRWGFSHVAAEIAESLAKGQDVRERSLANAREWAAKIL